MADLLEIARAAAIRPRAAQPQSRPVKPVRTVERPFEPYTPADIVEIDRLLSELAKMENWSDAELAVKLDQRQRMAPVNVKPVLREIRAAHQAALAVWPNQHDQRSNIVICKLDHVRLVAIDGAKR